MTAITRRGAAAGLLAAGAMAMAATSGTALAAYPEKPITVYIAWSAGGATDLVTRAMQPVLSAQLGTDLVIRNVAGAAGTIGTAQAARAGADGYSILVTPMGPITIQPHLRNLPYDYDSFTPIGRIAVTPMLMMVPKESQYSSVETIVEKAKASPGDVKFASTGAGTLPHIAILSLNSAAGIDTKHIPYKGSANVMKALLGGEVDVFSDQSHLVPKYDLKPLATWSSERLPDYSDVPTMKELGYDFNLVNWLGVFAPKGTPAEATDKLASALEATLKDASVIAALEKLRVTIAHLSPEDLNKAALSDYERNRDLLKSAGLLKE